MPGPRSARAGPRTSLRTALHLLRLRLTLPLQFRREALPDLLRQLDAGAGSPFDPSTGSGLRANGGAGDHGPRANGVASDGVAAVESLSALLMRPLRLWPTTCLWRALAGYAVLRAAGADVKFLIGLRRRTHMPGDYRAHAWLLRDGKPSSGAPPPGRFAIAFAWPADPGTLLAARERATMPGLRPSGDAILTELGDGTGVLLHLGTRRYLTLNATGVIAWKLLAGGAADEAAIAQGLAAEFPEIDPADIRRHVETLVKELREDGVVVENAG